MEPTLLAGLTFLTVVVVIFGVWWALAQQGAIRARLAPQGMTHVTEVPTVLRTLAAERFPLFAQVAAALPWGQRLQRLTDQAGWAGKFSEAVMLMILLAVGGAMIGGARMGSRLWAVACAGVGAAVPVIYLHVRRRRRLEKFSEQFPEALDMMTRSLRAGYAVGPAIQLVSEEMPDPVGQEFKKVSEEISLGTPPAETLLRLSFRIKSEDVKFFYTAVSIQREVGGNLAEILEKLAEVIRERYKILSYARVLASQQKGSAYLVAASPFAMALMIRFLSPGWFDPLINWQYGTSLVLFALIWQLIGFLIIRRIADIKV